jgi:single-stranded-DNA-specific exonuclease
MELTQDASSANGATEMRSYIRAVGWDWADRAAALKLTQGSRIDIAYRIRENDHPEFGGLEIEIAGLRAAE